MNAKFFVACCLIPLVVVSATGGGEGEITTPQVTTPQVTTPQVTTPQASTPQVTTPCQGGGGGGGHGGGVIDKSKLCVKNPSGLLDIKLFCDALCQSSGCVTCAAVCVANAKVLNLCNVKALVTAIAAVCPQIIAADICANACACCNVLGTINICVNACANLGILGIL